MNTWESLIPAIGAFLIAAAAYLRSRVANRKADYAHTRIDNLRQHDKFVKAMEANQAPPVPPEVKP